MLDERLAYGPMAIRRTQVERRAESERRLLDVTAKLIAARGTSGASFTEIARAAGCSRALPHYLFGTKTGLLQALVKHVVDQFLENVLEPELHGRGGLTAVMTTVRVFLRSLERPRHKTRAVYVLIGEALAGRRELRPTLNAHHRAIRALLEGWIREGMQGGEIRPDVDPEAQAALILGTMRGVGLQVLSEPRTFDAGALADEVAESIGRILDVRLVR